MYSTPGTDAMYIYEAPDSITYTYSCKPLRPPQAMSPTTSEFEFELPSARCSTCGRPPTQGREKAMKRCSTCLLVTYCVSANSRTITVVAARLTAALFLPNRHRSARKLISSTIKKSASLETRIITAQHGASRSRILRSVGGTRSAQTAACPLPKQEGGCVPRPSLLGCQYTLRPTTTGATPLSKTSKAYAII